MVYENKIVTVTGNEASGFLMYVNGNMMWFCDTKQDVYDQIQHAKDQTPPCGFTRYNTAHGENNFSC